MVLYGFKSKSNHLSVMDFVIFIGDLIMVFECSDCNKNWLSSECKNELDSEGVTQNCPSCGGDVTEISSTADEVYDVLFEVDQLEMDSLVDVLDADKNEIVGSIRVLLDMNYLLIDNESVRLTDTGRDRRERGAVA